MPTGYTAKILEGATFEQFIWECARAFGAFIMQRDDASDAPPVLDEKPEPYHADRIQQAKDRLATLKAWTDAEWKSEHQIYAAQMGAENKRYAAEHVDKQEKYGAMLSRVRQWDAPTKDHVGLKDFMVKQIEESISFDCGHGPFISEVMSLESWKQQEISGAERSIEYHTTEMAKEAERVASRNQWKAQLIASVPLPKGGAL